MNLRSMPAVERHFVLAVDLDRVVVDLYSGIRPIAAEWLECRWKRSPRRRGMASPEWNLVSRGTYEDLHRFAVTQRNLFRDLKPVPYAAAALQRLSKAGVRTRIITHRLDLRYFHEEAVRQTVAWLDHHGATTTMSETDLG